MALKQFSSVLSVKKSTHINMNNISYIKKSLFIVKNYYVCGVLVKLVVMVKNLQKIRRDKP